MSSVRTRNSNSKTLASLIGSSPNATMASMLGTKPENENCRVLSLKRDATKKITTPTLNPKSSQFSYFLNIDFANTKKSKSGGFTKVRIKIPKLFVKTLKKKQRNNSSSGDDSSKKESNVKKVTSMLAKTFVCNKPETVFEEDYVTKKFEIASISDGKDTNGSSLVEEEEFGSRRWEITAGSITYKTESEYSQSFRTNSIGSTYSSRFVEIDEGVCPACKRPLETELATKNFVAKAKNLKASKRRSGSSSDCSSSSSTNVVLPSCITRGGDSNRGFSKSSRNLLGRTKIWRSGPLERKGETGEGEEGDKELELCRKTILRGERCRPLEDDTDSVKYIEA
ncbi:hypothetical protein ACHQM5_026412 [Ranunculus cassubicifolius]